MKKLIVLMMLMAITAMAQPPADEEQEPIFTDAEYNYEAQIAWGSKANLVWEPVPVVWTQILPQTLDDHFYGITVLSGNRRVYWGVCSPNSTPENPEIIKVGIHMPPIPGGKWWGFYRMRFRPFPIIDPGGWSQTSRWTAVIDLDAMPIIGPASALVE